MSIYGFRNTTTEDIVMSIEDQDSDIDVLTIPASSSIWFYDSELRRIQFVDEVMSNLMYNSQGINYQLAFGNIVFIIDGVDQDIPSFYQFWNYFNMLLDSSEEGAALLVHSDLINDWKNTQYFSAVGRDRAPINIGAGTPATSEDGDVFRSGDDLVIVIGSTTKQLTNTTRKNSVDIVFENNATSASTVVADSTISAKTVFTTSIQDVSLLLAGVRAAVTAEDPGVGYTVSAVAPGGFTGTVTVSLILQESI